MKFRDKDHEVLGDKNHEVLMAAPSEVPVDKSCEVLLADWRTGWASSTSGAFHAQNFKRIPYPALHELSTPSTP